MLDVVNWDQWFVDLLDLALNESRVCGLQFDAEAAEARLRLEVLALPETGPTDPDPRRVVVLSGVPAIEVTLRTEGSGGLGPVLPVGSLDELETFFARLSWAHEMYGWAFVDIEDPGDIWAAVPSLVERGRPHAAAHTLRWFTECGQMLSEDQGASYLLQGMIRFDDLRVERADGSPVPVEEEFLADASRWWKAFEARDSRLSADAQRRAGAVALSWRTWKGSSVVVPGGDATTG